MFRPALIRSKVSTTRSIPRRARYFSRFTATFLTPGAWRDRRNFNREEPAKWPLPQDIRPIFQDIQDTLTRSDAPWIEQRHAMSKVKVLWVGRRRSGTWASLHHWKKGYAAPPHKHLAGAHVFVLSGKLQVRDGVLDAGDYVYEPAGVLHDATTALEDTTYLFIGTGPFLFFDENGFTRYTDWEVMERLRLSAEKLPQAAE